MFAKITTYIRFFLGVSITRQNTHISMKSISLFQKLLKAKGLGPDCISRAPAAILDLGTALQAYILDACTKLPPIPLLEKSTVKLTSQRSFNNKREEKVPYWTHVPS